MKPDTPGILQMSLPARVASLSIANSQLRRVDLT
jgi:hypothetical protein